MDWSITTQWQFEQMIGWEHVVLQWQIWFVLLFYQLNKFSCLNSKSKTLNVEFRYAFENYITKTVWTVVGLLFSLTCYACHCVPRMFWFFFQMGVDLTIDSCFTSTPQLNGGKTRLVKTRKGGWSEWTVSQNLKKHSGSISRGPKTVGLLSILVVYQ